MLRELGKGDPVKFLRDIDWAGLTKQAIDLVKEKIVSIRGAFDDIVDSWCLKRIIPDEALDSLKNASKKLGEVLPKVELGMQKGMQDLEKKFSKALDEYTGGVPALGITNVPNKVKTIELKAPRGNNLPGGQAAKALTKSRKTPDDFTEFKSMNHKKAAAGEYNSHQLMTEKGYTPLGKTDGNYKPGETGIDGIYLHPNPPPDYVITEAKYNTARLGNTKSGKQMSDEWITKDRLEKAGLNRREVDKILRSLKRGDGSVEKLLIRNKLDGSLVVKTLDENAKIISKALGF
ncbi:hypothetical protein KO495_13715 [Colwellia sp. D2M02]|uniref:hypothetical protein n=1 Tax=Colwellia sp. D2M02 TaxID=2841562 RepID=UPI001C0A0ADB|nr:hypothetical protein [Colwellia sp. D2M02]MBU2894367.1 hypothetical protein [Colwellia sp. D2M02]